MQTPVVRAEQFYLPPPELPADAWELVPAAERVWRWVEYRQQRRVIPPDGILLGQEAWARINHNRWVVDCLCGSAQVATPADPRFACTECGRGWIPVIFPADPGAAEAELQGRPPHERNWTADAAPPWDRPAELALTESES